MIKIITPIYKQKLEEIEDIRIKYSLSNNAEVEHIFIAPEKLDTNWYSHNFPKSKYIRFKDEYFEGISGYNKLMLSSETYKELLNSTEYICILQTDAILLKNINQINYKDYDYIGSIWPIEYKINIDFLRKNKSLKTKILAKLSPKIKVCVGNGGLSIRNNHSFKLLSYLYESLEIEMEPEDVVFSYFIKILDMRVPEKKIADNLFSEWSIVNKDEEQILSLYGVHGIDKIDKKIESYILKGKI